MCNDLESPYSHMYEYIKLRREFGIVKGEFFWEHGIALQTRQLITDNAGTSYLQK